MADETEDEKLAGAPEPQDSEQPQEDENDSAVAVESPPEDSIAISRSAYGQKRPVAAKAPEKKLPQRVVGAELAAVQHYTADDIDDETLIAPGRRAIGSAYTNMEEVKTATPSYTQVAESTGADSLALQGGAIRDGRTVSFKVKGIQWRAGFTKELAQTPLGHAIHPSDLPPPGVEIPESLRKAGIVIRAVNPRLQIVLGQLLPVQFRKECNKMRTKQKAERLRQLAIFYLPAPQGAAVGFIHEFVAPKTFHTFYLYVQTSVGRAPIGILDEVLKTLETGLPEGERADEYNYDEENADLVPLENEFEFQREVNQSIKMVSSTMKESMLAYGFKQGSNVTAETWGQLMRILDRWAARSVRFITATLMWFSQSWLLKATAGFLLSLGSLTVRLIWFTNRLSLGIARSPVTKKIGEVLGYAFDALVWGIRGIGQVFLWLYLGIAFVVKSFVAVFAGFFNFFAPLFRIRLKLNTTMPTFEKPQKAQAPEAKGKPDIKKKTAPMASAKPSGKSLPPTKQPVAKTPAPPKPKVAASNKPEPPVAKKKNPLGFFEDEPF